MCVCARERELSIFSKTITFKPVSLAQFEGVYTIYLDLHIDEHHHLITTRNQVAILAVGNVNALLPGFKWKSQKYIKSRQVQTK